MCKLTDAKHSNISSCALQERGAVVVSKERRKRIQLFAPVEGIVRFLAIRWSGNTFFHLWGDLRIQLLFLRRCQLEGQGWKHFFCLLCRVQCMKALVNYS